MELLQKLFDDYKLAFLCELDCCSQLEDEIRQQAAAQTETMLNAIRESAAAYKGLLQKAFEMGINGVTKESLDFQTLLSECRKYSDSILVEALYTLHNKGLSEYTPPAVIDGDALADALLGNAFEKKNDFSQNKAKIASLLAEIRQFRTWTTNFEKMRELKEHVAAIRAIDPAEGDKAQKLLDAGAKLADLGKEASKAGMKQDENELARIKKEARSCGASGQEIGKLYMNFNWGKKKAELFAQERKKGKALQEKTASLVPSYELNTPHPFFIGNLAPEKHWRIFIDETGEIFDKNALGTTHPKKMRGKLAALFVPENSPLPPLEFYHAKDKYSTDNQQRLIDLFTKGKGECGLLGVTLDGMAAVDLDYYYTGLERLIDITLRFLTPHEEGSALEFYVENRGDIDKVEKTQAMLQRTADACLYRFAKSFPEAADKFTLKMRCIAKTKTKDKIFLAHNGYVDTVACSWNGGRKELLDILKQNSLLNRCLLEGDVQELPLAMDKVARGEIISVQLWNMLIASPDRAAVDSPVNALLNSLGTMLRRDSASWQIFVNELLTHLDSKAINMRLLSKQVNYLAANMPEQTDLPLRLKAVWMTAQLAEKNHRGIISQSDIAALNSLIDKLYLEDAPLCCWSTLHMAVEETNAFRFEKAKQIILDFANRFGLFDETLTFEKLFPDGVHMASEWIPKAALTGVRYYGQLFSSLGQHEAFMGNFEKADDHFKKAVACYKLLSDGGSGDIGQTMSYLVINRMDYEKDTGKMLSLIEEYLGAKLEEKARDFAVTSKDEDKYYHAIMLRYFMELGSTHPAVKAYLELREKWKFEEGHPWEMIGFYRALLTNDPPERDELLKKAYNMALEGGAALHIIASVILGGIYYFLPAVKERLEKLIDRTLKEIPDMGAARCNALQEQLFRPVTPLELAKKVLPFNFR